MHAHSEFEELMDQYIAGAMSDDEHRRLQQMIREPEYEAVLEKYLRESYNRSAATEGTGEWNENFREKLLAKIKEEKPVPVHRVHFLRTAWFRYAAAVLIVLGVGAYVYINNQKEKPSVTQNNPAPVQNDVAPGGNRAMLTLSDGRKIVLDSISNGQIATDAGADITKSRNGEITYLSGKNKNKFPSQREGSGVGSNAYAINSIQTPRGGQYQITLSDGTKVWLNAESSITYPTAFSERERERRVSITGEVYFEVTKDKTKPFIVSVKKEERRGEKGEENTLDIEVLGTHFNINAYNNEPTINTTLLEGSVRLRTTSSLSLLPSSVLTLKPGQQGQLTAEKLSLAVHPDVEQVMAWKNGVFNFNNVDLQTAMRQLSRWYDVEVVYEGKIPKKTFGGRMGRDLNLSQVLKIISALGVKFRIEGKRLIVAA